MVELELLEVLANLGFECVLYVGWALDLDSIFVILVMHPDLSGGLDSFMQNDFHMYTGWYWCKVTSS